MPNGLPLSRFKAVLFDIDGTLIDSLGMLVAGLGDAFERYAGHRPSDETIRNTIGLPLKSQLVMFSSDRPSESELGERIAYTIERFQHHSDMVRPFQPACEALRRCHDAGLKTALVTSKSTPELTRFLSHFLEAQYVNATVCASDVTNPKPDPECVRMACRKLDVEPAETVFIGDSPYDIRAARAAEVASVAVTYGSSSEETLRTELPDLILRSPEQLLDWVNESLLQTPCHEKR